MVTWLFSALIGAVTGVLSGMGIGGGTLLVLYLTAALNVDTVAAAGINLLYFLGCAPVSLWFHARQKRIDWRAAGFAMLGGCPTALTAAMLTPTDSPVWLSKAFGVLLLCVGLREGVAVFHTVKNKG